MHAPTLIAFTIALGGRDGVPEAFPYGANVTAPADAFLTVHPDATGKRIVGDIQAARTGKPLGAAHPSVAVDATRRQILVRAPHAPPTPPPPPAPIHMPLPPRPTP